MASKKNRCGCNHAKASCKLHSKIKMGFMIKAQHQEYILMKDRYRYSAFNDEKKSNEAIIESMMRRLSSMHPKESINNITFYDNVTRNSVPLKIYLTTDF
jgi:hypothetical protein